MTGIGSPANVMECGTTMIEVLLFKRVGETYCSGLFLG